MSTASLAATGSRARITIGEESSYGNPVSPTHLVEFTSESISAEEDTLTSEAIRGDRGVHQLIRGNRDVSGDISFEQSASGFGMIVRHALGDYIKATKCDGGVHARFEKGDPLVTPKTTGGSALDSVNYKLVMPFAKEHTGGFNEAGGSFAIVNRNNSTDDLQFLDNSGSGFAFDSYTPSDITFVDSSTDSDTSYTGAGTTNVWAITLSSVVDSDGNYVRPNVNDAGGLIELGPDRTEVRYFEAENAQDSQGNPTKKLFLDPQDADPTDSNFVTDGDYVFSFACIVKEPGDQSTTSWVGTPDFTVGGWCYEWDSSFTNVYTHHIERGRKLPTGLTIEVDRDAAVFLYSGVKTTTLTLTYDTNAIVTGTVSYIGQSEYAMATLESDLLPDTDNQKKGYLEATNVEAFPQAADVYGIEETGGSSTLNDSGQFGNVSVGDTVYNITQDEKGSVTSISGAPNSVTTDLSAWASDDVYAIYYSGNAEPTITIGERTDITYALKIPSDGIEGQMGSGTDGVYRLGGVRGVDLFHPAGRNVDCRTSTAVDSPQEGSNSPLTSFETLVYIDGYFEEVLSGEVSLENNLADGKFGLGSRKRLALVAEQAEVTGSLTMEFDDGKNYERFLQGDFVTIEFKAISEAFDAEIGSTGVAAQSYAFLPKCKFDGETPNVGDTSFIEHDMPFTAVVDDDYDTTDLVIILVNGEDKDVEN